MAEKKASDYLGMLPHLGVLRFAGTDATSFLQGQISNDALPLTRGLGVLAAYPTPQGRVAAVFNLVPHSSGILALLPREIVLPILERLRKYILRAKVRLEDASEEFTVAGARGAEPLLAGFGIQLPNEPQAYAERDNIGASRVSGDPDRYWVVGPHADVRVQCAHGVENRWRLADVRRGLPQVYAATGEMFVAQMLNLDLVGGISFTKGCFTGQEIIARTQHLGRIKRRMSRLRLPAGTWAIGQVIDLLDGRSGRITELAAADSEMEALAVLNGARGDAGSTDETLPIEGALSNESASGRVAAVELALPYAIERP